MEKEKIINKIKHIFVYIKTLFKWFIYSVIAGSICGIVGTAFHYCVDIATNMQQSHLWLLYLLPVAGVLIIFCYHANGVKKDEGTNLIILSIRKSTDVPGNMTFLIFIGTVLTHLCGGSSGREGAALQIGGSIGSMLGKVFHLDEKEKKMIIMCGMAGLFSALFGTPLAAAIFSMEVITVGVMNYATFLPCILSSVVATGIARFAGVVPMSFTLANVPDLDALTFVKVAVLSICCAVIGYSFIKIMQWSGRLFAKYFENQYIRIIVGACLVILLTILSQTRMFNGAGIETIEKSFTGTIIWYAFFLKIIFTAVTMGSGFKGGEIIPSFFIGATFGNAVAVMLGLSPDFAAAVGLIAVFCSVVNCPMASVILSVELFGSAGILYFALACAICFIASGYTSLYATQDFIYDKVPLRKRKKEKEKSTDEL